MANMPKPELEQGAYIAYANEPGIIVDGSGGGGGAVYLELNFDKSKEPPYIPAFTYNDVRDNLEAGKFVFARSVYSASGMIPGDASSYDVIEILPVQTAYDNGEDSYNVTTMDYRFIATSPDAIMTTHIE